GAGSVDDGAGQILANAVPPFGTDKERCGIAALGLDLVEPKACDCRNAMPKQQIGSDARRCGQWCKVAVEQLAGSRQPVVRRRYPAVALQQAPGGLVDVVLPWREKTHMAIRGEVRADRMPSLEDQWRQTA